MKLSGLLNMLTYTSISGVSLAGSRMEPDPDITSIHYRSGDVKPGGLFIAMPGLKTDGHNYIDDALAKGAVAVVVQKSYKKNSVIVEVKNTRKALAVLAAGFYGNPSEKLVIIGITGTNGKTTTSFLIENILLKAGIHVGVIGTINYHYAGKTVISPMTTPESSDLQRILAEMLNAGVTHVVLEVSSHAIDLHRIDHCWIDAGVFTNLTQDHLDYHKTMDAYWECKKKLFTEYLCCGPKAGKTTAVINCDNSKGKELSRALSIPALLTGSSENSTVRGENIRYDQNGISGRMITPAGSFAFNSALVGKYNLENILSAAGTATALNIPVESIKKGIEEFSSVPGRLERIPDTNGRFVFVDYAHTPDALENVLATLKTITKGKLISVFGCGGDRDTSKRPQMGEIAAKFSDLTVITSDNPRSEAPLSIIDQIVNGTRRATRGREYTARDLDGNMNGTGYLIEPDRRAAIRLGIKASKKGDTVLIAGKGHETYQIIDGNTIPFDDRIEARIALGTDTV